MKRPVCAACEGEMKLGSGTTTLVSLIIVAVGLVLTPVLIGIPIVLLRIGLCRQEAIQLHPVRRNSH